MRLNIINKQNNVLQIALLCVVVPFSIIDANCTSDMYMIDHDNEMRSKFILNKEEQNNGNVSRHNSYDNIRQYQNNNNELILGNTVLSTNYILRLLWNNYKNIASITNESNDIRIVSIYDSNIQQHIDNTTELNNKLLSTRRKFKYNNDIAITRRNSAINALNKIPRNLKRTATQGFFKKEMKKFTDNIEHIIAINKQYEYINNNKITIDTYFKMQSLILNNTDEVFLISYKDLKMISDELNIFQQEISENINSFYDSCLIGNTLYKETLNDKLDTLNNKISNLKTNQGDIVNILKIVNKLKIDTNSEGIINKLKTLQSKIEELETDETLKDIKDNLILLNKKIFNLILTANLQNITNNLNKANTLESVKIITPTTNNILCWCSENCEDWYETLSKYEKIVINIFQYKLSNNQMTKQEFANTFSLLHKIADINAKIENYYYTAKLLCNLSPVKQPHPIILPRSLAV